MSGLPPELAKLNSDEKIELARLLMDSVPEEDVPVPRIHRKLIEERLLAYRQSPDSAKPWREAFTELETEA